jgi:hypothetical protein
MWNVKQRVVVCFRVQKYEEFSILPNSLDEKKWFCLKKMNATDICWLDFVER